MFIKENPIVPSEIICSICGFLLDVHEMGEGKHKSWYNFIVECERLFLRNIYSKADLQEMKIDDIEKYYEIFDRLLEIIPIVESALEDDIASTEFENFLLEDLNNLYLTGEELKEATDNVVIPKKFAKIDFTDKIIAFIYSTIIEFAETDKMKGFPVSKKLIGNLKGIINNRTHMHHSHMSGEIIGYAHSYCNYKVGENKTKIA